MFIEHIFSESDEGNIIEVTLTSLYWVSGLLWFIF